MEALFGSSANDAGEVTFEAPVSSNAMSLDDLFAETAVSTPVMDTEPSDVLDATWETVDVGEDEPTPTAAPPTPEQLEVPSRPKDTEPWRPSNPQLKEAHTDAELLVALACCQPEDRVALLGRFKDAEAAVRIQDGGVDVLVGQQLLIVHHTMKARANGLRQRLTHANSDVRATAAVALGVVGSPSHLPVLARLLKDTEPSVRRATVFAVRQLGQRLGRGDMAEEYVRSLSDDPSEQVREAVHL